MLDQLRAVPQLLHLRSGTAYTLRPPRLINTARLFGAINARDRAEAEAIISRSIARATVVGDRQTALYFWPAR